MTEFNSDTIEKTKQQIRGLVSEINQLSKTDMEADDFFPAYLERVIQALAAVGGAVWLMGESRRLESSYQVNVSEPLLEEGSDECEQHRRLLQHVAQSGESRLTPPLATTGGENAVGNPSRYLLVMSPLKVDGEVEGVIEIFQRPDGQPATQRGYERFLNQMVELASEWMKSCKLKQFTDRHSLWAQADHFARLAHDSLDLRETCYTVANEARRVAGTDRVSVALMKGRVCKVEAVSGQDTVEPRSNIVVAINELSSKVAAVGEPLWYDGNADDLPPQIEKSIEKYVDESYAKSVVVLPLRRPKTTDDRLDQQHRRNEVALESNESNEVIGALIIEQIESDLPRDILEPRVDLVYEHAARAIANSLDHRNIFLMPVFKAIGKTAVITKARNLPKTLLVAAVILLAIGVLFFIPARLMISAEGTLEPVEKKSVFVSVGGSVSEVLVSDKSIVTKGQPLIRLKNFELEAELTQLRGQLNVIKKSLDTKNGQRGGEGLSAQDIIQLDGDIAQLEQQEITLMSQIKVRKEQERRLTILSPIDGQVMLAWDVERSLERRRVEPGQVVMEIADLSKEWELQLNMLEGRMRHITMAEEDAKQDERDLDVSYILETDARNEYEGTVRYIDDVTRIAGEKGSTVLMRIKIDKEELLKSQTNAKGSNSKATEAGTLRPGASVKAKVDCGDTTLAYRWFHEVGAWVQRNVLF
jgi:multidrug efflux pump subunit AcrA (membrane-fusion protein)